MKLSSTALLAACGVVLSSAVAFAIPVKSPAILDPSALRVATTGKVESVARATAGDTLLVDARLGHASLSKGSSGETYLFAQVTATTSDDKAASGTAAPRTSRLSSTGRAR